MKQFRYVYIVEDDPTTTFLIKRITEVLGCIDRTIALANGQHALEQLEHDLKSQETLPDAILLDINMPVMDGWEFLDALKTLNQELVPVVLLTSSIDPRDREKAKLYPNVKALLIKPLTSDSLQSAMNMVDSSC